MLSCGLRDKNAISMLLANCACLLAKLKWWFLLADFDLANIPSEFGDFRKFGLS